MGIIDIDIGLGDLLEIGKSTKSLINKAMSNQGDNDNDNESYNKNDNNINNNNPDNNKANKLIGGNVVVKCPGCGHKSAINDGDGIADRCEYCGTVIGN